MPTAIDTATTSRVRRMTVSRVGQATFFSSAQLSTRYRRMPVSTIGTFFLLRRGGRHCVRRGGRGDRTRTCNRWFWRPVLYQLSYTPAGRAVYFVSRCSVCCRQRGQNLFSSSRPGSFLLFFRVLYVRALQVVHARASTCRFSAFATMIVPCRPPAAGHAELGPGHRGTRGF